MTCLCYIELVILRKDVIQNRFPIGNFCPDVFALLHQTFYLLEEQIFNIGQGFCICLVWQTKMFFYWLIEMILCAV